MPPFVSERNFFLLNFPFHHDLQKITVTMEQRKHGVHFPDKENTRNLPTTPKKKLGNLPPTQCSKVRGIVGCEHELLHAFTANVEF